MATPLKACVMAENKKSFILYTDLIYTVEKLPDKKAGELFKHILQYVNDKNPNSEDMIINIAFEPIKQQLKRDLKKYEHIREKRSKAGKASADKRQQVSTSVESVQQSSTNSTVSVNVNDNVNDIKEYIYTKFYDSEIKKSKNPQYEQFVKYLFGDNMLKQKLTGILSIKNQLTSDEFEKVINKCEVNKKKLGDILTKMENDKKYYKGKTSFYRTILNWTEDRFIK